MAKKRKKTTRKAVCSPCSGKLNPKAFALAAGIIWGLACLIMGLAAAKGYGTGFEKLFSTIYIGYSTTISGSIIGGIWGFVDAFIGGYIFVWLYNKFL
ncbi:bacteriophage holin [Candidatus Woesearchaeota archaeon]|nr:bacteriophage holin [Candidatus Woesearchaeota archaeon]MBW2994614.1 bacteriophage holin [Candidatus Woesearchaeota archaeon]